MEVNFFILNKFIIYRCEVIELNIFEIVIDPSYLVFPEETI